jgi:glycosyltransferase involved in cell wall biosynthesis
MLYGRLIARRLAQRQDKIIAISQNTANDIMQFFGVSSERITIIHNGLEHERFFPRNPVQAKAQAAQRYGLQQPFFLYVARLEHPGKNHVRLIEAFNEFKKAVPSDWQLVLGGSDWHGSQFIHQAIRSSPFSADIRCLGFVPDEALPDLYRAADVFVYPSLYEGFGLPPIEAMACGCPVVCSARGALGEVVANAAAMVEPEDAASITKQLRFLANDSAERARLRMAGLARAKAFDWKKTGAGTLEVYEKARKQIFLE